MFDVAWVADGAVGVGVLKFAVHVAIVRGLHALVGGNFPPPGVVLAAGRAVVNASTTSKIFQCHSLKPALAVVGCHKLTLRP